MMVKPMKPIKLLLLINASLCYTNDFAQESHNFYFGCSYPILINISKDTSHQNCNNPATGLCNDLNYDVKNIPFINIGYYYQRQFNTYSNYGFFIDLNYFSNFTKSRLLKDQGYYDFYMKYGIYPDVNEKMIMNNLFFFNLGFSYANNKLNLSGGLGSLIYLGQRSRYKFDDGHYNIDRSHDFFVEIETYFKCSYVLFQQFSLYINLQTPIEKQSFYRYLYSGLGIEWRFSK